MAKTKGAAVAAKGKQGIKSVNNKAISKKQKKPEEEAAVAVKAEIIKATKQKKIPQKVVPSKNEDSEEEEDASDSGADVKEEVLVDEENEDAEDDSDDEVEGDDDDEAEDDDDEGEDDDDEDDEQDIKQEEEDSDEEPAEQPIEKKTGGIPKIKTTPLPKDFPTDQTVLVKCLPSSVKLIDIYEVFGRFGELDTVAITHGKVNSAATLGYTTAEAAQKALTLERTTKIKDNLIKVFPKIDKKSKAEVADSRNKTIMVRGIKTGTTQDEIKAHFESCGVLNKIRVYEATTPLTKAIITFKEWESVAKAKAELDLSQLGGVPISILPLDEDVRDPERTVILKCSPDLYDKVSYEHIKKLFSDEVVNITLVNGKDVMGFVLFKEPEGAKNALKLSGVKRDNIALEIVPYGNTKVHVTNIKPGTTEEEIRKLFSRCGEIKKVTLKFKSSAIVNFADQDGFCKSFTLNESYLNGKPIFLEPFSLKKIHLNSTFNRNGNNPQVGGSSPMKRKYPTNPNQTQPGGNFQNRPQQGGKFPNKPQEGGKFPNKPQQGGKFPNKPQQGGKFPNKPQQVGKFQNKPQQGGQKPPFKKFKKA